MSLFIKIFSELPSLNAFLAYSMYFFDSPISSIRASVSALPKNVREL